MAISTVGQNGLTVPLVTSADASISGLTVGKGGGSGSDNTAVGANAMATNSTGVHNTAFGYNALTTNSTGQYNTALGQAALQNTTVGNNTAVGQASAYLTTTGQYITAIGTQALLNNTTGSNNVAQGYQALYSNTTASNNTAVGYQAGYSQTTGAQNIFIGRTTGYSNTTGTYNTFIGDGAGYFVTTGGKNTIIGGYNGNQGGLDIRTASNYIVLSDGDSNVRGYFNNNGSYIVGSTSEDVIGTGANGFSYRPSIGNLSVLAASASALAVGRATTTGTMVYFYYNAVAKGSISTDGSNVAYNTSSDYRLKENIVDLPNALATISQLKPRQFDWKETKETTTGFIAHELAEVVPHAVTGEKDAVDAEGNPVYQGIDTSFLVATLTAAIQELKAEFDAYKASHP